MSIRKINAPIFKVTLPYSGEELQVSSFVGGQYKALTSAIVSNNLDSIVTTFENIVSECVKTEGFEINGYAYVDIEYLFAFIYSISADSIINMNMRCINEVIKDGVPSECDTSFIVPVNMNDIEVTEFKTRELIDIGDGMILELKYPTWGAWHKYKETGDDYSIYVDCIKSLIDGDNVIVPYEDEPFDEFKGLVESLPLAAFEQFTKFITDAPTIKFERDITCPSCGHTSTMRYEGLVDFFG